METLSPDKVEFFMEVEIDYLRYAYANADLVDAHGERIPDSQLCTAYLKLYRQTPHAIEGLIKPEDPSRFIELTAMRPEEWHNFVEEPMITEQSSCLNQLWVYDNHLPDICTLEEYLIHFYSNLYPYGYALGLSCMGFFQILGHANVLARCFQLDLETPPAPPEKYQDPLYELQTRTSPRPLSGFIVRSSSNGVHFHGTQYELYTPIGLRNLAIDFGCALLLNREGTPRKVDERSIGHQLNSYRELWDPKLKKSETGCLRLTSSLLKDQHPELLDVTF